MSVGLSKAILISESPERASAQDLEALLCDLDLPKRALSLPVESDVASPITSFIELWGERDALRETAAAWPFSARAWIVAEFVPIAYQRSWPSGERSPGLRMVSAIHRRAGITRADFEAHWRGPHTQIARSYTIPVWHYNQNVVVEALDPESDVDGFVGMHFHNAEDLRARWQDHPAEAARGSADAALFMAVERTLSMTAIETVWEKST